MKEQLAMHGGLDFPHPWHIPQQAVTLQPARGLAHVDLMAELTHFMHLNEWPSIQN